MTATRCFCKEGPAGMWEKARPEEDWVWEPDGIGTAPRVAREWGMSARVGSRMLQTTHQTYSREDDQCKDNWLLLRSRAMVLGHFQAT
mmetsp:Transcript_78878/g.199104  ORF Transcript_78878/g.199104 Transcript_78878/m.199104 type:complete len:88 (-) Transcript_78878:82-345(-)